MVQAVMELTEGRGVDVILDVDGDGLDANLNALCSDGQPRGERGERVEHTPTQTHPQTQQTQSHSGHSPGRLILLGPVGETTVCIECTLTRTPTHNRRRPT